MCHTMKLGKIASSWERRRGQKTTKTPPLPPPPIHRNTIKDELMEHEEENMDEEIVKETLLGVSQPQHS